MIVAGDDGANALAPELCDVFRSRHVDIGDPSERRTHLVAEQVGSGLDEGAAASAGVDASCGEPLQIPTGRGKRPESQYGA